MAHVFSYHAWSTDYTVGFDSNQLSDGIISIGAGKYLSSINHVIDEVQLFLTHEQLLRLEVVIRDAIDKHVTGSADVCENELRTLSI